MSAGWANHYTVNHYLENLTKEQFIALAVDIATGLHWDIRHLSEDGLVAVATDKATRQRQSITIHVIDDKIMLHSESIGSALWDRGDNKENIENFEKLFADRRYAAKPEDLDERYEQLRPQMVSTPADRSFKRKPGEPKDKGANPFYMLFLPRKGYFVTPIIIELNILIFLLMALSGADLIKPDIGIMISWGADVRSLTLAGQWWRLITNMFLHYGIIHLLMNMFALLYISILLESHLGRARYALAYLLCGIAASANSLYWHDYEVSAGASGAIFGMYGVFLAMLTTNLVNKAERKSLLLSIVLFVAYNLAYGQRGYIDNAAHVGGLLAGFVIGYIYYPSLRKPKDRKLFYYTAGAAVAFVILGSFTIIRMIPRDFVVYEKTIASFNKMQNAALSVYDKFNSDSPRSRLMEELKDTSIFYWKKNIEQLTAVRLLEIPEEYKNYASDLLGYCEIRLQRDTYFYRKLQGQIPYDEQDSIPIYDEQIRERLHSLNKK